ncbi:MAG: hypothetical protein DWI22_21005 [Planctomycetota bacterium]|nr:MAG: hypothetical protein DWI22_21005 [Planctomycetota bacterium]
MRDTLAVEMRREQKKLGESECGAHGSDPSLSRARQAGSLARSPDIGQELPKNFDRHWNGL